MYYDCSSFLIKVLWKTHTILFLNNLALVKQLPTYHRRITRIQARVLEHSQFSPSHWFQLWSKSIKRAFLAKNKIKFVNGKLPMAPENNANFDASKRCNGVGSFVDSSNFISSNFIKCCLS